MSGPLRVLIVEDHAADVKLVVRELRKTDPALEYVQVQDEQGLRAALADPRWEVVLSDWTMPGFGALQALAVVKELRPELPFIVVSGTIGEELAVQAMRSGARDYVLKDKTTRLGPAVQREVQEAKAHAAEARRREQDERFFNVSLDLLCIVDFDGRFLRVNGGWERVMGWTGDELRLMRATELTHPDDLAATAQAFTRLEGGERLDGFENRCRCKDGGYRTLLWSGSASAGERLVFMAARDITARSSAEEKLRSSEMRYRALFDLSPLPKWLYDIETLRFVEVNDAALAHYGYSRDEFVGMTIRDIRPEEELDRLALALRELGTKARDQPIWKHRKKDGTLIHVEVRGHSIGFDGRQCRLVTVIDVTERTRLEEARMNLTLALQHELEERGRAEQALRISEARFARLWESGIIGIAIADIAGNVIDANDEYLRTIGHSREELRAGQIRWEEMTPPEWRAADEATRRELLLTGIVTPWERELIRKDATRVPVLAGAALVEGDRSMGIAIDLSALKRAERELHERVEVAALGADVGMAVTQADSLRDMLQRCADAVVSHLAAAFAGIWTLGEGSNLLELQASSGMFVEMDGGSRQVKVGESTIGKVAERRRPISSNEVASDPLIEQSEWTRREGMVAFAGHPLIIEGKLVGVMAMFARHPIGEAPLRALASIADAVALGIRRKTVESAQAVLEAQLRQAQKIEAIGQLSGGIAHDFNNLLAVILSRTFFLLEELAEDDPRRADAAEIKAAAERAAALTRQLLAFSRKQVLAPRVLDLNAVLEGLEKMLHRLIGEDIALTIVRAKDLGAVKADAGQLEQVIMNLVVNARDAMPKGGRLTLQTSNAQLDAAWVASHPVMIPGDYVLLTVSDTGSGMSEEVQQHLFEPFFTTKEQGKGTGLGLSTSYGIVKQSGGYIWVDSQPGQGTVFRIHLPRVDGAPQAPDTRRAASGLRGTETVLLVDDDDQVRSTAERILHSRGYTVLAARSGPEAVAKAERHAGRVELVLSDMVMPGESGPEMVQRLRAARPEIAVLFMSGFTEHAVIEKAFTEGAEHLQKPFTPDSLAERVRATLDRAQAAASAPKVSASTQSPR